MLPALKKVGPNLSSRNGARISKIIARECEGSAAGAANQSDSKNLA
jgi:hypothetical protein